jgi:CheY-like chemotaxis protein
VNITSQRSPADSSVLVVEDDPAIVELVQAQLEKAGFRVDSASDGQEGLAKVHDIRGWTGSRCWSN